MTLTVEERHHLFSIQLMTHRHTNSAFVSEDESDRNEIPSDISAQVWVGSAPKRDICKPGSFDTLNYKPGSKRLRQHNSPYYKPGSFFLTNPNYFQMFDSDWSVDRGSSQCEPRVNHVVFGPKVF